jgi:hypothetical protein
LIFKKGRTMFRKSAFAASAIALASCAHAVVVTYTLSLNEGLNGQCQPNRFVIYATDSQGDNYGLESFAVRLRASSDGGAVLTTFTNRTPAGTFDIDPTDPNYDPNRIYPTQYVGFRQTHIADSLNGVVAGIHPVVNGPDLVRIAGFGQQGGSIIDHPPAPYLIPPDQQHPYNLVHFGPYQPDANTDVVYGADNRFLPSGSLRLATGVWSGAIEPSFDPRNSFGRAAVWGDSALQTTNFGPISIEYQTYDYCTAVPEPTFWALALLAAFATIPRRRQGVSFRFPHRDPTKPFKKSGDIL